MRYTYKDERTRALIEDDKRLMRRYGPKAAQGRDLRLAEIETHPNLAALLKSGSGRWHELDNRDGGTRNKKISGDITGNQRILLSEVKTPYGLTVEVEIDGIEDTHKKK